MFVSDLIKDNNFTLITKELHDTEIKGVYSCDLLSWVMSHAKAGNLWCTVLTHVNIVAIASLLNLSCIVVCEDAPLEENTINKANQEKINIIKTKLNCAEVIKKMVEYEKVLL